MTKSNNQTKLQQLNKFIVSRFIIKAMIKRTMSKNRKSDLTDHAKKSNLPLSILIRQSATKTNPTKKRTNSSYISNTKQISNNQMKSHKKYTSGSFFNHNTPHIMNHDISQLQGHLKTEKDKPKKGYQSKTKPLKSRSKPKIRKNVENNQCQITGHESDLSMFNEISNKIQIDSTLPENNERNLQFKQDNIKTDFEEQRDITLDQIYQRQSKASNQNSNVGKIHRKTRPSPKQLKQLEQKTSKQISELQSRSQTIDLLKFTIKTKLGQNLMPQSPHIVNSLLVSENKQSQVQYFNEILQIKQVENNFYVQKITGLQSQVNRLKKERQSIEVQLSQMWKKQVSKVSTEKKRVEDENKLLQRENQALRAIIMKKIKANNKKGLSYNNQSHQN